MLDLSPTDEREDVGRLGEEVGEGDGGWGLEADFRGDLGEDEGVSGGKASKAERAE